MVSSAEIKKGVSFTVACMCPVPSVSDCIVPDTHENTKKYLGRGSIHMRLRSGIFLGSQFCGPSRDGCCGSDIKIALLSTVRPHPFRATDGASTRRDHTGGIQLRAIRLHVQDRSSYA